MPPPWRTLIDTTTYALHDTTCTRPLAFSLALAAIYPTHPLIQTTTKATEYHGMEFLFRIAFYTYTSIYHPPTLWTDIDTTTDGGTITHPPTSLTIDTHDQNHATPKPPPVSLLFSSTPNNQPSSVHSDLFFFFFFCPTSALALHWRRPDRDLVENPVYFPSLVFRLVFFVTLVSAVVAGRRVVGCVVVMTIGYAMQR